MVSRSRTSDKADFLPSGVREFAKRRMAEISGVLVGLLSAAIFIALVSYNSADSSLNTANGGLAQNLIGPPGAWAADLLLQSIGISSGALVIVLAAWSWRIGSHRGLKQLWLRITALPITLLSVSIVAALPNPPSSWPIGGGLGGITGDIILRDLGTLANWSGVPLAVFLVATVLLAVTSLIIAMGLSNTEWKRMGNVLRWFGEHCGRGVRRIGGGALTLARSQQIPKKVKLPKGERIEPHIGDIKTAEPDAAPERVVAPKSAPQKTTKRARAPTQRKLDLGGVGTYELPSSDLLDAPLSVPGEAAVDRQSLEQNARLLESVLDDFSVRGEIVKVRPGPVVTLYELEPAPGTKSSRVIGLADDIARSMSAVSVRVAVVPGRNAIGIELPNNNREIVSLRELLDSKDYDRSSGQLLLVLGKEIGGTPILVDLARMPHLLIAGTTGSGKSVAINTMILSLLYRLSPKQCKLIMIDPKMLELSVYDGIPHLLTPVVTDPSKAVIALRWAVREMEDRYRAMSNLGVRNIAGYNARIAEAAKKGEILTRTVQTGFDPESGEPRYEEQELGMDPLPYVVVIVDEMADLMLVAGKEVEAAVQRLAQMARAAGIHLIMATQRPSVDVITGTIKANFPTRVSFQVTSKIDSRTILGESGAEQLLGQGDMLYMAGGGRITRVHGPFVSDEEVERVVGYLKSQAEPEYLEEVTQGDDQAAFMPGVSGGGSEEDSLYDQAVALVCRERKASTSFVQRHLQIGYNRAARIIERMEAEGVISAANHVGKREIIARDIENRA